MIKNMLSGLAMLFARKNQQISHENRKRIIFLSFFLISFNVLLDLVLPAEERWRIVVSVGCILTFVLFAVTVGERSFLDNSLKKEYLILLEIIGASFIFNGVYFGVLAYMVIGFVFALVLPVIHISLMDYGISSVIMLASKAIIGSYIIFLALSFVFGPSLEPHYSSFLGNPNLLGYYIIVVVSALLWRIYVSREEKLSVRLPLLILLASAITICFFTASRTSMVSVMLQMTGFEIAVFFLRRKKGPGALSSTAKRIVLFAFVLFLSAVLVFFIFAPIKRILYPEMQHADPGEAGKITSDVYAYLFKGLDPGGGASGDAGIDVDSFTSGRQGIWEEYIDNLGFLGHASEEREIESGHRHYAATNAHNVYIQIAYSAGILAGIVMALLMLLALKDIFRGLIGGIRTGRISEELMFASLCTAGFLLPSLTSSGYMMYTYPTSTFFWISMCALTIKGREGNAENPSAG